MEELWTIFKDLCPTALTLNHYDLADQTGVDSELWKDFLSAQEVKEWIKGEMQIIAESELKKMTKDASASRSVGQAQLMNTIKNQFDTNEKADGPVFIYSYVPLSVEQAQAVNVLQETSDIFAKNS